MIIKKLFITTCLLFICLGMQSKYPEMDSIRPNEYIERTHLSQIDSFTEMTRILDIKTEYNTQLSQQVLDMSEKASNAIERMQKNQDSNLIIKVNYEQ